MMVTFVGKFFDDDDYLIKKYHLEPGGAVQRAIDESCIAYMDPYIPFQSGMLTNSINPSTIGTGEIIQDTPYARYQYYGELYVDPITKKGAFYSPKYGFWSRPNVAKVPSGKNLNYSKTHHPKAGSKWFERMKADHKEDILENAQKAAEKGK